MCLCNRNAILLVWCCLAVVAFSDPLAIAAEPAVKAYDFEAAMARMRDAEGSEYFRQKEAFLKQPGVDRFLISLSALGRVDSDWLAQVLYDSKFRRHIILAWEQGYREELTAVSKLGTSLQRRVPSYRELSQGLMERAGGRSFNQLFDADGKFLLLPIKGRGPNPRVDDALFGGCSWGFCAEVILKRDDLPDLVKWEAIADDVMYSGGRDRLREELWRSKELWARHVAVYTDIHGGESGIGTVFQGAESDEPAIRVAARASLARVKRLYGADEQVIEGLASWWRTHSPEERDALLRSVAKHWPEAKAKLDAVLGKER